MINHVYVYEEKGEVQVFGGIKRLAGRTGFSAHAMYKFFRGKDRGVLKKGEIKISKLPFNE